MTPPRRLALWCCSLILILAFPIGANATWFTNQTGLEGGSSCYEYTSAGQGSSFSSMTANKTYPVEFGQSCGAMSCTGSSDTAAWNYIVMGNLTVKDTSSSSETLTVKGYNGPSCSSTGTWPNLSFSGCYTSTLFSGNKLGKNFDHTVRNVERSSFVHG